MIVAIDGPAGSGKSTVARRTAAELGFSYLDSGAMYRAIALRAMRLGIEPGEQIGQLLEPGGLEFYFSASEPVRVTVDGEDVTEAIRDPAVSALSSKFATLAPIREFLVGLQRSYLAGGDFVAEGRDIGSVVAPEAAVKVFLTASASVRASRRADELTGRGEPVDRDQLQAQMADRDHVDRTRNLSPLVAVDGAAEIDTTDMAVDQVVATVVQLVRSK